MSESWEKYSLEDKVDALKPRSQKEAEAAARLFVLLDSAMRSRPLHIRALDTSPKCLCQKKKIAPEEIRVATHVKGVRLLDTTCDDCRKFTKGCCYIYCLGCKALVMVRPPCKTPSGLYLEANGRYHVRECPRCSEEYSNKVGEVQDIIARNPSLEPMLKPLTAVVTLEEIRYAKAMNTSPFENLK